MPRRPSFQFYPGDWMKDPALRRCTAAARGAWIDMLCLMFECEKCGLLATNNVPWTQVEVARQVSCKPSTIAQLVRHGVVKIDPKTGAMFSKRMMEDEAARRKHADRARNVRETCADSAREPRRSSSSSSSSPSVEREETPLTPQQADANPDPDRVLDGFDQFAKVYPGGQAMGRDARGAYWEALREGATPEFINAAAAEYAESLEGKSEFVPFPTKWLNDKRFNDDRSVWWAFRLDGNKRQEAIRLYRKRQADEAEVASLSGQEWDTNSAAITAHWERQPDHTRTPRAVLAGMQREQYAARQEMLVFLRSKAGAAP